MTSSYLVVHIKSIQYNLYNYLTSIFNRAVTHFILGKLMSNNLQFAAGNIDFYRH